jgi:hypothetical protein
MNSGEAATASVGWALLPVVRATQVGQECPTYIQEPTLLIGVAPQDKNLNSTTQVGISSEKMLTLERLM